MTYSNLIEPISPKESPAEFPDASVDGDDDTDGDIKQIVETGSVTVFKDGHYIHCLTVIGQIEGHFILPPQNKTTKYEHVIPQLVAIEESKDIEGLIIILNTVGGDIEAGLALAELLSGMRKPTVSLVLGGGHSIGVPQTLSYFDKMQERIVRFVADNSSMKSERFRELMTATGELVMDVGTVLDGESAVKEGLIDSHVGLSDALDCLYGMITKENR